MMRLFKAALALAGTLALMQYLLVYYNSLQFKDFVQEQAERTRLRGQLQQVLLNKAKYYSLPVTESDIDISAKGAMLRVAVDYTVPFNLVVYRPGLKFHATGLGFVRE
jgi:hypothetical protein